MILALATALLLATDPPPRPDSPPAGARTTARTDPEGSRPSDEDSAVVDHLELLEQMDLLEDLPVVDGALDAPGEAPRADEKPRR